MKLLLIFLLLLPPLAFAQIKVVASIKPLVLILNEIGGDKIRVEQLIPDHASHHDYPLKMSDHRRLHNADLVVWIGADLESFLTRPLSNLPNEKILSLMDLSELHWPNHHAEKDLHEENEHHHNRDPHLWLNPKNVEVMVNALVKTLSVLDQKNSVAFQQNADKFILNIKKLDNDIEQQMLPLRDKGFAVYHHGYSHYVERYQLTQLGYLALTPEKKSGAKHLHQLIDRLDKEGKCIFAEPLVDDAQVRAIANKHQLQIGYLDLLGVNSNSYSQLMQSMADSFSTCLANRR